MASDCNRRMTALLVIGSTLWLAGSFRTIPPKDEHNEDRGNDARQERGTRTQHDPRRILGDISSEPDGRPI